MKYINKIYKSVILFNIEMHRAIYKITRLLHFTKKRKLASNL